MYYPRSSVKLYTSNSDYLKASKRVSTVCSSQYRFSENQSTTNTLAKANIENLKEQPYSIHQQLPQMLVKSMLRSRSFHEKRILTESALALWQNQKTAPMKKEQNFEEDSKCSQIEHKLQVIQEKQNDLLCQHNISYHQNPKRQRLSETVNMKPHARHSQRVRSSLANFAKSLRKNGETNEIKETESEFENISCADTESIFEATGGFGQNLNSDSLSLSSSPKINSLEVNEDERSLRSSENISYKQLKIRHIKSQDHSRRQKQLRASFDANEAIEEEADFQSQQPESNYSSRNSISNQKANDKIDMMKTADSMSFSKWSSDCFRKTNQRFSSVSCSVAQQTQTEIFEDKLRVELVEMKSSLASMEKQKDKWQKKAQKYSCMIDQIKGLSKKAEQDYILQKNEFKL